VRGIIAVCFGISLLFSPMRALATLIILWGVFMIADGVFSVITWIRNRELLRRRRWLQWFAVTSITAGIFIFFSPVIAAVVLVSFFAFGSFAAGIINMMSSIALRRPAKGERWYILSGIASVAAAIFLLLNPIAGVITLAIIFAVYAISDGILLLILSFNLKKRLAAKGRTHFSQLMPIK